MLRKAEWDDAKRVFDAALALDPADRDAYVREACRHSDALLGEVRSLLEWHDDSSGFLDAPAARVDRFVELIELDDLIGRSLGVWRIIDVIGRGGMGVVYRAERADDAFTREAALKVIAGGSNAADVVRRFKRERETLAALDHPNIARLLDGGTTPAGAPYFVMEYVDGIALDQYCDRERLSVAARLRLFRSVCQAVQYAHRNLVIHRDLKPDNILVTRDGLPKLLDFGIATLLSERGDRDDVRAASSTWLMTPDFASPEQLEGRPVTVASDVYSLGVLLHVLLTGQRPYQLTGTSPDALRQSLHSNRLTLPSVRAAAQTPESMARATSRAATPRALSWRLRGDLDAIVSRAVSLDVESRYQTVEELLDDLERHRTSRPVRARGQHSLYTVGRFVNRHSMALAICTVFLVVVSSAVWAVLWQARLTAEARARAERRLDDVRHLAHEFMFDIHDEIVNLPGTTRAREMMVRTANDYLTSLAREASGDTSLQRELANGLVRLGDAQGHPGSASFGDTSAARASYERAITIAESLRRAGEADIATSRTLAMAYRKYADVLAWVGDMSAALQQSERSKTLFIEIAAKPDATPEDRLQTAVADIKLGDVLGNPNFPNLGRRLDALTHYEAALHMLRQAENAYPDPPRMQRYLGITFERIGTMREASGELDAAAEAYEHSFTIRKQLASDAPLHTDIQRDLGIAYEKIANVEFFRGDFPAAVESYRGALAQFQRLADADWSNASAARSVAIGRENLARALLKVDQRSAAVRQLSAALAAHWELVARDAANVPSRCDAARLQEAVADAAGRGAQACTMLKGSQRDRQTLLETGANCVTSADLERLSNKLRACR